MKKLFALLVAVALGLSLGACGAKSTSDKAPSDKERQVG